MTSTSVSSDATEDAERWSAGGGLCAGGGGAGEGGLGRGQSAFRRWKMRRDARSSSEAETHMAASSPSPESSSPSTDDECDRLLPCRDAIVVVVAAPKAETVSLVASPRAPRPLARTAAVWARAASPLLMHSPIYAASPSLRRYKGCMTVSCMTRMVQEGARTKTCSFRD